jgi:hypothetical protein
LLRRRDLEGVAVRNDVRFSVTLSELDPRLRLMES